MESNIEEDISLSHTGLPVERRLVHHVPQKSDQTQLYRYTYDHQNRLLTTTHSLNNGSAVTLASNTYDNLGRLVGKVTGGISTSYTYNVRSWLKSITSGTKFSETLFYNESHDGNTPRWGGDISAMDWKADSKTRGYVFSYDGLSRLTQASYSENGTGNGHYNTEYTYDKMGNVQTLKRYGLRDNNQYGLIDNLTFTYNGNQVTRVEDAVSGPFYSGAFHFINGSSATTEYTYDQNGNMTKDLNKNISSIQYNLLNLPSKITYQDGRMINYIYSATGTKLSVTYTNGGTTTNNQYCGNMLYENGTLKQILIDGGYITFNGSTPQYHFYLKDHLGNNRVVVNASGTVEQVNHYYPFGGLMGESTNGDIQRYKYNGKELDRMNGLDWYDYGARYMDGIRFTTIDPMAEKYYGVSPYVYCKDNPVKNMDPDGMDPGDFFKTLDNAAIDFGKYINGKSIKEKKEYITAFYKTKDEKGNNGFSYIEPIAGNKSNTRLKTTKRKGKEYVNGREIEATGHTHGAYDEEMMMGNDVFSGITKDGKLLEGDDERKKVTDKSKDIGNSNAKRLPDYLVTPNGSLQHYDPSTGHVRLVSSDMPKDENDPNKVESAMFLYK